MRSRDFCYWLQGFIEVGQPHIVTMEQLATIRNHLNMVFRHEIDPSHGNPEYIEELRKIHEGGIDKARRPEEGNPPNGTPVTLPSALTDMLPPAWLGTTKGDGSGGAMNC